MFCTGGPESRGGGSNLKVGGHVASVEREPIRGSGGRTPSGVQRQSPWSGGRSPPEAERFLGIIRRKDTQYLPLYPAFGSAEISPNIA